MKPNYEARKYVRFVDNEQVELISPNKIGTIRIKNCKIPISTSDIRLEELQHIESQIAGLSSIPDFGYEGENFVTENEGGQRNWKLLTNVVMN